jgi:hypothetical protein
MNDEDQQMDSRVLVCVVRTLRDFERMLHEHWYRIPVRHTPQRMAASYLAFFPTAACGAERWQVRWLAAVEAIQLMRRRDLLPEEYDHRQANQLYYRFTLGQPQLLPTPIPAKRLRRISFIATTLATMQLASDVRDLWHTVGDAPTDVWGAGIGRRAMKQ